MQSVKSLETEYLIIPVRTPRQCPPYYLSTYHTECNAVATVSEVKIHPVPVIPRPDERKTVISRAECSAPGHLRCHRNIRKQTMELLFQLPDLFAQQPVPTFRISEILILTSYDYPVPAARAHIKIRISRFPYKGTIRPDKPAVDRMRNQCVCGSQFHHIFRKETPCLESGRDHDISAVYGMPVNGNQAAAIIPLFYISDFRMVYTLRSPRPR